MKTFFTGKSAAYDTLLQIAFLVALAVLCYANSLKVPFLFDDLPNITENPYIRISSFNPENLSRVLKAPSANRLLASFSFAVNYYFHGYHVTGYHVVNLIIHILTALLVWRVARHTLRLCRMEDRLLSFLAAALWLVNPVHTQSVTYIVQRMNSMAGMFFMLALLCYIKARIDTDTGRSRFRQGLLYGLCIISAVLGLVSKETVAVLPIIMFLYEWFFFQNLNRNWLKKRRLWFGLVILAFVALCLFYTHGSPLEVLRETYKTQDFSMGQRLLTEAGVVIYYLSLILYPDPSRLNVDYDFPVSLGWLDPVSTFFALAALLALFIAAIYSAPRHRLLSFAIFWFLITLVIESSFIGLALIFEHRTYLPSLAVIFFGTVLLYRYLPRTAFYICLMCLIFFSGLGTWQRNSVWGDLLSFWQDCANKSPEKARPANGVGMAYQKNDQPEKAMEWFQKAIYIDPGYEAAYSNIGVMLIDHGQPGEALPFLEKAVAINPKSYEAFHNLGSAMDKLNRLDEAVTFFRKSISLYPDYAESHNNLGAVLMKQGKMDSAIRHLKKALWINPEYSKAYNNLGLAMEKLGRTQDAIDLYTQALLKDPEYATAHFNLATIWFQKQDLDRARFHLEQAARYDPDSVLILNNLGTVLVMQKKYASAIDVFQRLVRLLPESPTVYYNLACVYALQDKKEMAVNALKQAVNLGYERWDRLKNDPDLNNIHDTTFFKTLMR
jgi:tetratricopeptide (TPR) repeat protein